MGDISTLHDFAQLLLETSAEALDTVHAFDPAFDGAPTRQFVSPGAPVHDCEQLSVHVPLLLPGATSPGGLDEGERHLHGLMNLPTFVVTLVRCIPVASGDVGIDYRAPSAASLSTAAQQLDYDAWALWNHLYWAQSSGLLLSLCDNVFFDGISAIVPSGGFGGWTAQVRAALDGYVVAFGT